MTTAKAFAAVLLFALVTIPPASAQFGDALRRAREQLREAEAEIEEVSDAAEDVPGDVQGTVENVGTSVEAEVDATVDASVDATVGTAVVGGSPTEQVARMNQECTARAASAPAFNTCAVRCTQAEQALGNVNMSASDADMLFQRCSSAYGAAQTAGAAAAEAAAADSNTIATATAEIVVIAAPNDRFVEVRVPSHRSAPRLGLQDSMGLDDPAKRNQMSSEVRTQLSYERNNRAASLSLYIQMAAAGHLNSALNSLDRSRLLETTASAATAADAVTLAAQRLQLNIAARASSPAAFREYFCNSSLPPTCAKPNTALSDPMPTNWGGTLANEFERQAAYRAFGERDFSAALIWTTAVPREAYQVGRLDLGEYNFETGAFDGHLYLYTSNLNENAGVLGLSFVREPSDALPDSRPYSFAMSSDAAQRLVASFGNSGTRLLYAVARIRLERAEIQPLATVVFFRSTSPEIELYTDEALTNRYGSIQVN